MLAIAIRRTKQFDRTIRIRNWVECGAAVLVTAFYTAAAWKAANLLLRAGYTLVAAGGPWIIFYMLRHGRESSVPAPDLSLAGFQQALLRKYDHQIRLLKNVKFWYLLPFFAGLLLASAGGMLARAAEHHPVWPEFVAVAVYTAVFAGIWWLNEGYAVGRLRRARARLLEQVNDSKVEQR